SKIRLVWNAPSDNAGVVEYLVYQDGVVGGYSRLNDYTCVLLEPDREYAFSVSALDAAGNESARSVSIAVRTGPYRGERDLIHPGGFEYIGAFALPETFAWGGEAVAYHAEGDGGQASSSDGCPGSLFVTNLNQIQAGWVGETSIPAPVVSSGRSIGDLSTAETLVEPVNIRPQSVNGWEFDGAWRTGLAVVPGEGRLYSAWGFHYTVVEGEKHASIGCCDASDLSGSGKYGAWYVGAAGEPPTDQMNNDWLFTLPQDWSDAHCAGRNLVAGRCRDGGLSGLGPTLFAFSKVGSPTPPSQSSLEFTTLLQYGPVEASDDVHFPDAIDGYNHADEWRDAMWISAGGQRAVALVGNKALGQNWYGYTGERMRNDWVGGDIPWPEFPETDPDGKGWRAHNRQPMAVFFDPDDLAAVAAGSLESCEPQPYSALWFPKKLFFGSRHEICSATFDSLNGLLYITELAAELDGKLVVHVWDVNPVATSVRSGNASPSGMDIYPNHPNPFNPGTSIRFRVHEPRHVRIHVFDLKGREIAVPADRWYPAGMHALWFDASGLSSGLYLFRITAGESVSTGKMLRME
ncbi:T9SS type A sorting domain-containing protein, partial [bacterium]|nr:T9SS type A sorting domain-containing protein [bacterium]